MLICQHKKLRLFILSLNLEKTWHQNIMYQYSKRGIPAIGNASLSYWILAVRLIVLGKNQSSMAACAASISALFSVCYVFALNTF